MRHTSQRRWGRTRVIKSWRLGWCSKIKLFGHSLLNQVFYLLQICQNQFRPFIFFQNLEHANALPAEFKHLTVKFLLLISLSFLSWMLFKTLVHIVLFHGVWATCFQLSRLTFTRVAEWFLMFALYNILAENYLIIKVIFCRLSTRDLI